ncbi:hypothetical protein [Candidatus Poriferisodalis sp.]|uniref:hypothetical protein n=1 Tax=Candidatus Poriferisodalis sp. TaxID=3101277 RepID=UPI003B528B58
MPKYVEEAWIGQNGRRVPASMRDTIDAMQASQDVREMQMLLADLGATEEARRMAQIQRTLDLMVRSEGRS